MAIPYLTLDEAYEAMVKSTGKTEDELLGYPEAPATWTSDADWD
jgi:hypothetical protein